VFAAGCTGHPDIGWQEIMLVWVLSAAIAAQFNNRMSPAIQPVTVRAAARPAPGRLAGYAERYTNKEVSKLKEGL